MNKNITKYLFIVLSVFFSLLPKYIFGATPTLKFDNINEVFQKANMASTAVLQDQHGFIWITSETGLYRFDGYNIKHYQHEQNNPHSISANYTYSLYEDSQGFLWIGTFGGGLNRYDSETDQFTHYKADPDNPNSLSDNHINTIQEDQQGHIWLGTANGLNRLDKPTGDIIRFQYNKGTNSISNNYINALIVDNQGIIWIGTLNGLNRLDPKSGDIRSYYNSPDSALSMSSSSILSLHQDASNKIWIGTNAGLNQLIDPSGIFKRITVTAMKEDNKTPYAITSIASDKHGVLWLGSKDNGIGKLDPATNTFIRYTHISNEKTSLVSDYVTNLYFDLQNTLWISTLEGISKLTTTSQMFSYYSHHRADDKTIIDENVLSIYQDSSNNLWIGTYHQGLYQYNEQQQLIYHYRHDTQNSNSISKGAISSMIEDRHGNLWIAIIGGGLNRLNSKEGTFKHYRHNIKNPDSISSDSVHVLYQDKYGIIWIGTHKGLNRLNPDTDIFTHYQHNEKDLNSLSQNNIMELHGNQQDQLWIGTQKGGLDLFSTDTENFTHFKHEPKNPDSLSSNFVTNITEDTQGQLWIGTIGGGLNMLQSGSKKFTRYTIQDGLISDSIMGVIVDNSDNLWLSTDSGVSHFKPKTNKWTNFTVENGLQDNDFYLRSAVKNHQGEIFFGGIHGYNRFWPNTIEQTLMIPSVTLTDFLLFNRSVQIDSQQSAISDRKDKGFTIPHSIYTIQELALPYNQNLFTFEFASLGVANPKNIEYAYQLSGWDDQWINTDYKKRSATYSNIPNGKYELNVKARRGGGIWGQSITISLTISPPIWKTWWAYILYFLLIMCLIIIFIWLTLKKRIANLKQQQAELEKRIAQRDHQAALSIANTKDQLLANISHEFRTPLTLILGPLESLLNTYSMQQEHYKLNLIKRNGQRLLAMVDQLLDLAQLKNNNASIHQNKNVWHCVNFIVESFSGLAEKRQIELSLTPESDTDHWVRMVPDSLEKILTNLISNAFKYSSDGGKITIKISDSTEKMVHIEVSDTGFGIAKEDQSRIFDRFVQINNHQNKNFGIGIGLALVKEIVSSHQGTIDIQSEPNEGSQFMIKLPLSDPQNKPDHSLDLYDMESTSEYISQELNNLTPSATLVDAQRETQVQQDIYLLIVEDNEELLQYLLEYFSTQYNCLSAINGEQGLSMAQKHIPDLIISDVMMPVLDGYQLAEKLRNDDKTSHIPILLLTAKGDMKSRIKGWKVNVDDYITKPFHHAELATRVSSLLMIRAKLREKYGRMLSQYSPLELENNPQMSPVDRDFVKRFEECISDKYQLPELNRTTVAEMLFITERQLNRKLGALVEHNFSGYLRKYRLRQAIKLLQEGLPIAEVSDAIGFSSPTYFSRCFKNEFNQSPSELRQIAQLVD